MASERLLVLVTLAQQNALYHAECAAAVETQPGFCRNPRQRLATKRRLRCAGRRESVTSEPSVTHSADSASNSSRHGVTIVTARMMQFRVKASFELRHTLKF